MATDTKCFAGKPLFSLSFKDRFPKLKGTANDDSTSPLDFVPTEWSAPFTSAHHGHSTVTVEVGFMEDRRKFTVHRNLLVQSSDYFEEILADGRTTVSFDHFCPMAFEIMYQ